MTQSWFRGLAFLLVAGVAPAQQVLPALQHSASVPPIVKVTGSAPGATGKSHVIFSVYAVQAGGTALWSEGQDVTFDDQGTYSVLLGANHTAGLPRTLFAQGEALWLGIQLDGQPEEKRILLVSVPYALKAGDAETIGGKPLSAFVLAGPSTPRADDGLHYLEAAGTPSGSSNGNPSAVRPLTASVAAVTATGTLNQVAKFDGSGNLVNASLFDNGKVGIGTTTPAQALDVTGSVNLTGKLFLPNTAATAGVPTAGALYMGGSPAFHAFAGAGTTGLNIFVGSGSGNFTMGGTGAQGSTNSALGVYTLRHNSSGSANLAVGYAALYQNTTGATNSAVGYGSMYNNTTGGSNSAVGKNSLYSNLTGTGNTALGTLSLYASMGSYNIGMGYNAGSSLTTGSYNIDIGHVGVAGESGTIRIGDPARQTKAFMAGVTGVTPAGANPLPVIIDANGQLGTQPWGTAAGTYNTAVGAGSLAVNTGTNNTATGWDALNANSTGSENNAFGMMSLAANNTGSYNAAFGSSSLTSNTTGNSNSAFGFHSLFGNQTGGFNAAFGTYALSANSTGNYNVAMGYYALSGNTTAVGNVAIGTEALYSQSFSNAGVNWSSYNTAVGHYALATNQPTDTSTGLQNTAVGAYAAWQNSTGSYNSAFGIGALYSNTTAQQNTALGAVALFAVTAGGSNTAVGANSLVSLTMGSGNIAVGKNSGQSYTSSESNNILIGNSGAASESNVIRIGTAGTHNTAFVSGIRGVTPASTDTLPVVIDANGQLGTAAPISAMNLGASQTGTVRAVGINYIISLYGIFPSNSTGSATYTSQMIGEIRMFAGTYAPQGWAFCDGALLSISSNTALFSILGTTYGGNGTTTFALPDLRSAVPMHTQQ
ncbi:MAG TPA: tail fiber protein [Geothrix sp.]|nr:tail fiber protein [Geothrix sp.]